MGDMNLQEFRSALRYSQFNRADLTNDQLNRWTNWAYRHICQPRIFRHRELQVDTGNLVTLATGVVEYDLTEATLGTEIPFIYGVIYVQGVDSANLATPTRKLRGGQDIREFAQAFLATGEPTHYALYGTKLWVNRRPTATQNGHVVLVQGWSLPDPMSLDDETTLLRSDFDEIILLGARWRGWREQGRFDMAELAKGDFVGLLGDMQEPGTADAEDWGGYFQPHMDLYQRNT